MDTSVPALNMDTSVSAGNINTSAPARNINTSAPAENMDTSVPALNMDASAPAGNINASAPAGNINASVPAENMDASVPAENMDASVPAENIGNTWPWIEPAQSIPLNAPKISLRTLVNTYNKAMKLDFMENDMRVAMNNEQALRMVEKYINPMALPYIWHCVADEGTKRKVTEKRLAAFIAFSLPDKIMEKQSSIKAYCFQELENKLDKIFRIHACSVTELLKTTEYRCDAYGNIEPIKNGVFFPHKDEMIFKCKILKENLLSKLPKEERHDIIAAMEAI